MRNTRKENVAEHSFMTALFAHALCVIRNELFGGDLDPERAATLALYHEAAEVFTGDLPTPVKYYGEEIRTAYKSIEKRAEQKLIEYLPAELRGAFGPLTSPDRAQKEWKYVKYADKIAALVKCKEENAAGNREFAAAHDGAEKALRAANDDAVNYFLDTFAPSFGLSLDETL